MFSEKVNAQTITLTCNVKSHFKLYKSENWENNNFSWDLEINQVNQRIIRKQNVYYEGQNYDLDFYWADDKVLSLDLIANGFVTAKISSLVFTNSASFFAISMYVS